MGLTQKEFSERIALPYQTLKYYEQGRRSFNLVKYREIKKQLGYNTEQRSPLRAMIDYLRITVKDVKDLNSFIHDYLFISPKEFTHQETSLMMYNHLMKRGDIWIFDYADKEETGNYQMTLQLSGRGCRQLELILESKGLSWRDFLSHLFLRDDVNVTRLDIALDELYLGYDREEEQLKLSDLLNKVYNGQLKLNKLKTWNFVGGGNLKDEKNKDNQGLSLYFGSRQSTMFFNFYEKRYELARKNRMTLDDALESFHIWNRYEVRFSDTKSQGMVKKFLKGSNLAELTIGIINSELSVYDGLNALGQYIPDKKWQRLFGYPEEVRLSTQPEPYSLDKSIRWIRYQVAPTLKGLKELSLITGVDYINPAIEDSAISEEMQEEIEAVRNNWLYKEGGMI